MSLYLKIQLLKTVLTDLNLVLCRPQGRICRLWFPPSVRRSQSLCIYTARFRFANKRTAQTINETALKGRENTNASEEVKSMWDPIPGRRVHLSLCVAAKTFVAIQQACRWT